MVNVKKYSFAKNHSKWFIYSTVSVFNDILTNLCQTGRSFILNVTRVRMTVDFFVRFIINRLYSFTNPSNLNQNTFISPMTGRHQVPTCQQDYLFQNNIYTVHYLPFLRICFIVNHYCWFIFFSTFKNP